MGISEKTYISVSVVGSSEMRELNKKYNDLDGPTDVLSFEIKEEMADGTNYLGDVVINKDQAQSQASEYGNTLEEEISKLVAHGVLHLLGVHHKGDDH